MLVSTDGLSELCCLLQRWVLEDYLAFIEGLLIIYFAHLLALTNYFEETHNACPWYKFQHISYITVKINSLSYSGPW